MRIGLEVVTERVAARFHDGLWINDFDPRFTQHADEGLVDTDLDVSLITLPHQPGGYDKHERVASGDEFHDFIAAGVQNGLVPFIITAQGLNIASDANAFEEASKKADFLQSVGSRDIKRAMPF